MPAPFIVIEGTDGSGKQTQTTLLVERLRREGKKAERISFPHYGEPSAYFVEHLLRHKTYGDPNTVPARTASVLYAVERYHYAQQIRSWQEEGIIVIADRYVGSNKGHQTSKIQDASERKAFVDWLNDLEYGIMEIPTPNITVLLHVPAEISFALQGREQHEASLAHLKAAEMAYLELLQTDTVEQWSRLACVKEGTLRPIEEIHEQLWALLSPSF